MKRNLLQYALQIFRIAFPFICFNSSSHAFKYVHLQNQIFALYLRIFYTYIEMIHHRRLFVEKLSFHCYKVLYLYLTLSYLTIQMTAMEHLFLTYIFLIMIKCMNIMNNHNRVSYCTNIYTAFCVYFLLDLNL